MARQFVVQLENRPGELAHLARALAARGIDLRHIGGSARATSAAPSSRRQTTRPRARSCMAWAPLHRGRSRPRRSAGRAGWPGRCGGTPRGAGVNVCGTLMVGRKPGVVEMIFCVDDEAKAHAALHQTEADEVGVTD